MKISQKHIQYILLLLIVVIAVCAYQFGYVKYIEKANKVKEENKAIQERIDVLNEKEAHRDEWNNGIGQSEKDIRTILAKYGSGNTPEKSIMFVKSLEEAAEMSIPTIGFNGDTDIFKSSDLNADGTPKVIMKSTYITVNFGTTYEGLKKCMDYINSYPERMNVHSFSASYNQENGQLTGNMIINMYSVSDDDHKYVEPVINGIDIGTENIFGTVILGGEEGNIEPSEGGEDIDQTQGESTGETD